MTRLIRVFKDGALYSSGKNRGGRTANNNGGGLYSGAPIVKLVYSISTERKEPQDLDGSLVSGQVAIYTHPNYDVTSVVFKLSGIADHTDNSPQFDLVGSSKNNLATLWDSATVSNGAQTITAVVTFRNNSVRTLNATFNVANEFVLPRLPSVPLQAVATPGDAQLSLAWSMPIDLGNPEFSSYQITSNFGHSINVNDVTTTSVVVSGLDNHPYAFAIKAISADGASPIATFNTAMPLVGSTPTQQPASSTYPNETVTGWQPTGVTLAAPTSGKMAIYDANLTLDGIDHSGIIEFWGTGTLYIRRSRLSNTSNWVVRRQAGYVIIEDCELDGKGRGSGGAVVYSNYTLRRCNIHSFGEGPRISGGVIIEDSWIHHMVQVGINHTDAIQSNGGTYQRIRRNRIDAYNPDTNLVYNAGFQYGEESTILRDSIVEENYFNGGNYTINGGGGGTTGSQVIIRNNKFGHTFRYGVRSTPSASTWVTATNVFEDTNLPVASGGIQSQSDWIA